MSNEFEFVISGSPVSQQTRRRERLREWKAYVRNEAEKYWSTESKIFVDSVRVQIIYFYNDIALDIDNIVKPILDAIVGLVYVDDAQVTDITIRKRNFADFKLSNATSLLAESIKSEKEFLYVVVTAFSKPEAIKL